MKTKWLYEDDQVCVDSFFQIISFEKSFEEGQKEIEKLIKKNALDWSRIPEESWKYKLSNINYYFRLKMDLPSKGLPHSSARMKQMVDTAIKNDSNLKDAEREDFGKSWFLKRNFNYKNTKIN